VARYLQEHDYRIIPVNPNETEVAKDAVRAGAKVLWLQL